MVQEQYSKWEQDIISGVRYRTIGLRAPNYQHTFAVEVLNRGHRKLFMATAPEFTGALSEHKRISTTNKQQRTYVACVHEGAAQQNGIL